MARGGHRGGRGGRGGGHAGAGRPQPKELPNRVCKPSVPKLPTSLQIHPLEEGVPKAIVESLMEFRNFQPFFSALERIAPEVATPSRVASCWLGISGDQIRELVRPESDDGFSAELVLADDAKAPVFLKRVHILDPLDCIEGECVWPADGSLPAPGELWMNALEKLNDPMNEAYVDAVFAMLADRLVASNTSPHWLRCYGTFPARVARYAYNITEEYPSLRRKSFWTRHQAMGLFQLRKEVAVEDGSRRAKEPLAVNFSESEELGEGDFEISELPELPATSGAAATAATAATGPYVAEEVPLDADEEVASVQLNPKVRIQRIEGSPSTSTTSNTESEDSDDDAMDYFAEFTDFPVQVTLLERAEGTMDELLDTEATEAQWLAWIFQVIAGLTTAQHWFGFVHNDLHTNNIMWSRTDREYLYYRIHGKGGKKTVYRVPTHGYIMKIIDFGRASFHMPEPAGFFISDAFFPGNDAGQQYNCDPFFDARAGKKVEPNPSFDLCRLAVSLLEAIFPTRPANAIPVKIMSREGPKTYAETVSPLYNLLWEWLTDDDGKNVLREPNGQERYPDFDLYSAIAADVHRAVPCMQLEKPVFADAFKWSGDAAEPNHTYDLFLR